MAERLYLDHNATSPLRPAVKDAMLAAMEVHNASSIHTEGRAAKAMLEQARASISDTLGVTKEGIVFTGSGTEADNLAIYGLIHGPAKVRTLFVSAIEHEAIRAPAKTIIDQGGDLEIIPVTVDGVIDLAWLEQRLASYDPDADGAFAVCVMAANNETGVLQPTQALGPMVWPKGGFVVVDAVQAVGKTALNFDQSGADLMAIAAHKIGGPTGVGALLMKPGIGLAPFMRGGGQEQFRRAGTENIIMIAGLAKVLEVAQPSDYQAIAAIRDQMEAGLPDAVRVWGQNAPRLPNTLCLSALGFAAETQVMVMDLAGFAISAGSACSSGKVRRSTVLTAMGVGEEAASTAIRVSLGWDTPIDAANRFIAAWTNEYQRVLGRAVA